MLKFTECINIAPHHQVYKHHAYVHEENKCSKLHKYLYPCESVRKCFMLWWIGLLLRPSLNS